jgi:hypothetical protein
MNWGALMGGEAPVALPDGMSTCLWGAAKRCGREGDNEFVMFSV